MKKLLEQQNEIKREITRILLISNNCFELYNKFWFLRSPNEVGLGDAEINVKIYKDFGQMFTTFEESVLVTFSVIFRQLFDQRPDSVSLYKLNHIFGFRINDQEIDKIKNNKDVQMITRLRHKFFAHKDYPIKNQRILPAYDSIKKIYSEISELYAKITNQNILIISQASTDELESLFWFIKKSNSRRFSMGN